MLWEKIESAIEAAAPEAFAISDWMALNPEISGQEHGACTRHAAFLRNHGYNVKTPAWTLETAYDAVTQGKAEGPAVALMAEYDALPGVGQGCGHNVHGAMTLLAAAGLKAVMPELCGTLRVIGCPAEEGFGGKVIEAREGAFDGVALALMIHCSAGQSTIPCRALALEGYDFTFTGKPAHAAGNPWNGVNALNGVQLLLHALDMLRQHVKPTHRISSIITSGGLATNVIPERAVVEVEFRAPTSAEVIALREKIFNCARGAALATGTEVSWTPFEEHFDDVQPNYAAEELMSQVFTEMGVKLSQPDLDALGSTDVGNVSYHCPAIHGHLDISEGIVYVGHSHEFATVCSSEAVHKPLKLGAKILSRIVYRFLTEPEQRAKIAAEFATHKV